jgi:trehalose utilization protein
MTQAEKHKVYKEALEAIDYYKYMCIAIDKVVGGSVYHKHPRFKEIFSELFLFKPGHIRYEWFANTEHNLSLRKTILQFCIEMTKP